MASQRRADALADRIEKGARELEAFAQGLSEKEWKMPCNDRDRRPLGVLVHHVASMYPIEIDVVKAVASGKAIEDVTWEAVAGINSKHNGEHGGVTKAEALDLLRRNSRDAAAAVRKLTDAELDTAAPFSLSFGAPMTAQFVIEDHPLRHPWHHLARMKKTLGR